MTITKGQPWGQARPLPPDGVTVRTDREAAAVIAHARAGGHAVPTLGLLGGDLCRTLGGMGDEARLRSEAAVTFPVDVGVLVADGRAHPFIAHVVVRDRWWRHVVVIMNAQWIGAWNAGPRAHPNDGLLDVYEATLRVGELRGVRRRLPSGTHLPHPRIAGSRGVDWSATLRRPRRVFVDGHSIGRARSLAVRLEPDAATVVV